MEALEAGDGVFAVVASTASAVNHPRSIDPCPQAARTYNVMGPAKASLESCSRALAQELGSSAHGGIRVNCLSPGPVRTMASRGIMGFDEMRREAASRSPLGRDVELEEIAGAATFLASASASGITGQTLHVDCGFSAVI